MSHTRTEQKPVRELLETEFIALPGKSITIMIVDDHVLIRQAFSRILSSKSGIERIITVRDYDEAKEQVAKLQPDIIWLDMHRTLSESISAIGCLRKLSPTSHIIVLAELEDEQEAFAAIMAGAQGYRSKQDLDESEITAAIEIIHRGEFVLRPALTARIVQRLRAAALPFWAENDSQPHLLELIRKLGFSRK